MNLFLSSRVRALCWMGIVAAAPAAMAQAASAVIDNPGGGHNRIEVTGNSARNVQVDCAGGPATAGAAGSNLEGANVNSVNVDGRALKGRTTIISGRNSRDVHATTDCRSGRPAAANVNSVNIR